MATQTSGNKEPPTTTTLTTGPKSYELLTCTINPPFSYVQLELVTDTPRVSDVTPLDNLQVRSYCNAALKQFLGATGAAIAIDILKVEARDCWLRVPQQDLSSLSAAVTAWPGVSEQGNRRVLRVKLCSDYLGAMVGSDGQDKLWAS